MRLSLSIQHLEIKLQITPLTLNLMTLTIYQSHEFQAGGRVVYWPTTGDAIFLLRSPQHIWMHSPYQQHLLLNLQEVD